ncbi:nuclear transport factor 2 family protein [Kribbella sp. NPDC056951]|uniref:nuclear transport factor 2 family protein n=1 Tax=Kribbella sp. NPDC056951 TaxID=3345978 RepID=UPI003631ACCB
MRTPNAAQKIAEDYVHAWTGRDVEKALSLLADNVVCEAPNGTFEGIEGIRGFLEPFVSTIISATVIEVLGNDSHAAAVYVTDTRFLKDFRGMDYITVEDGKITHMVSHFDLLPMATAGGNAQH